MLEMKGHVINRVDTHIITIVDQYTPSAQCSDDSLYKGCDPTQFIKHPSTLVYIYIYI